MALSYGFSIIIAFLVSYLLTPKVRNFFISRHWVEDPRQKQQKSHNATALAPVPRGGGIALSLAVLLPFLVLLPFTKISAGILIAVLLTLFVGVIDDLYDISPHLRLGTNILAALIIVASGIGIAYISNPMGGIINLSQPQLTFNFFGPHSIWILSDLLAVFWIVWCMNIIGWSAGVDGQLPGIVAISAFFIGLIGFRFASDAQQFPVIILSGALCGAYLGFIPYNFFPQSIMPGYSGKSLAGLLLSVLSILSGAKLATLLFLLGIPMLDAVFVILRRLLHKKSPFYSDGSHLHHQLLKIGWSRSQIALFYWLVTLVLGLISLFLNSAQKMYIFIGISLAIISMIIFVSRRT